MRRQHHFLPELRHRLSVTKCGHATLMWMTLYLAISSTAARTWSSTSVVLFIPHFWPGSSYSSPLSPTFFIASRNVSESKIHFLILQRHKREIFMRMDTFTVYSTFDWDQLVKNSRPHTRTAGENALKLVKKISLNVICWKLPKTWLRKSRRILLSFVYLVGWANL